VAMSNAPQPRSVALTLPADIGNTTLRRAYGGGADLQPRRGLVTLNLPALGAGVWMRR